MNRKALIAVLTVITVGILTTGVCFAADPLEVAPNMYKLQFENDRVRVMEVTFQPGEAIAEHSHPDHFVRVLEAGKLKISKPDGTSNDVDLNVGDIIWIDAETHSAVNIGDTVVRLLVIEVK